MINEPIKIMVIIKGANQYFFLALKKSHTSFNSSNNDSIFKSGWPSYDPKIVIDNTVNVAIQVNGKLRGSLEVDKNLSKEEVLSMSKDIDNVKKYIDSGNLIKEIYVPGKIVNFVIK